MFQFDYSFFRKLNEERATLLVSLAVAIVFMVAAVGSTVQNPVYAQAAKEVHVKPTLLADSTTIKPGTEFLIGVEYQIEPNWHIYYKEAGEAGMPTQITWKLPPGFKAGELLWEKPHKFVDSGITTYGYADKTIIAAKVTPPADLKAGSKVKIEAELKWLSCKDVCLPGKGAVSIDLPIADTEPDLANKAPFAAVGWVGSVNELSEEGHGTTGSDTQTAPAKSDGSSNTPDGTSVLDQNFKIEGQEEPHDIWFYLGYALVGGFILNFMPCVLPVIAIKIMSFIEQADEAPARVRLLGLTFSSGIILSFLALAAVVLAIRAAGQSVGWGFQFQSPAFVIVMCVIILLLSLSLFGLFYVSFSAGQEGLDKLAQKEGYVGTFFKGVLATTLSTPCTAPFLGAALGFAFAQPDWVVLGIFFASGLGMSLPYLVFTAFPKLMKFFPKPGMWMEKFKESMGFVLMATVVWLMGVLGNQVGPDGVTWTGFFLVAIAFAAWIVSRFTDLTSDAKRKAKVWTVASLVGLGAFYFCIVKQPSVSNGLFGGARQIAQQEEQGEGKIKWQPFTVDALNKTLAANNTVLLDFTASWCLTCKANESLILNSDNVKKKLEDLKVVTMKADWTNQDADITKLLNKFGRSGVPLYVVFPAGKPTEPIVLPEVITESLVIEKLDQAGPSKPAS